MNKFIVALVTFVALSCSASNVGSRCGTLDSNVTLPQVADGYVPSPSELSSDIVINQFCAGQISQEELYSTLDIPHSTMTGGTKFFPDWIMVISTLNGLGGNDPWNCARQQPHSWTIDCGQSLIINCTITITVPDTPETHNIWAGTWVMSKTCDEQPIGNWSLYGLTVNFDTIQRIF